MHCWGPACPAFCHISSPPALRPHSSPLPPPPATRPCSISSEVNALTLDGSTPLGSGPLGASLSGRLTGDSEQPSPSLPSIHEMAPSGSASGAGLAAAAAVAGAPAARSGSAAAPAPRPASGGGGTLDALRAVPGNAACCDCGAPDPDWASLNLGQLMCIECSGVHRRLGVHISKASRILLGLRGCAVLRRDVLCAWVARCRCRACACPWQPPHPTHTPCHTPSPNSNLPLPVAAGALHHA